MPRIPIAKCRPGSAPKLEMELQGTIWSFGAPFGPARPPCGRLRGTSARIFQHRRRTAWFFGKSGPQSPPRAIQSLPENTQAYFHLFCLFSL